MIEKIELTNFKGIGGTPATIRLGKLTLLFGGNSSGKSTVLHALAYAREIFTRHNCNADRTILGGDSLDLGGFKEMVHGHKETEKIRMRFYFAIDRPFGIGGNRIGRTTESTRAEYRPRNGWVQIEIGIPLSIYRREYNNPCVLSYRVGYEENPLAELEFFENGVRSGARLCKLNINHGAVGKTLKDFFANGEKFEYYGLRGFDYDDANNSSSRKQGGYKIALCVSPIKDALPADTYLFNRFSAIDIENNKIEDSRNVGADFIDLQRLIHSPHRALSKWLNDLFYVGPIRQIPERKFSFSKSSANSMADDSQRDVSSWASGRGAYDALPNITKKQWEQINEALAGKWNKEKREYEDKDEYLVTGYEFVYKPCGLVITEEGMPQLPEAYYPPLFKDYVEKLSKEKFLELIPLDEWFGLFDIKREVLVQLSNVGAGLSQIIPLVICMAKNKGGCLMFEQPELHLHPKQQAAVGDLLIRAAKSGTQIIAETHSIHLILRVLRRIRETYKEKTQATETFTRDELKVLFASSPEGSTKMLEIAVSNDGEFPEGWPDDFFDRELKERLAL